MNAAKTNVEKSKTKKSGKNSSGNFNDELIKTAKEIATPGKGIGDFNESTETIGKKFEDIELEDTHPNR